ncbi:DUF6508 domain-containing protein [Microbulbifer sp. ANSA003]|uniref:DUF6508 domain-containing protein n=1 Tax=Microbulbifer sp. ANSA003 TaxID=3243360 RepID=UPI004041EC9A
MRTEALNIEDIEKLISCYQLAILALPKVTRHEGYPYYPDEISDFMNLLERPPWVAYEYQPKKIRNILDSIDRATFEEVRWALTTAARAERFCEGSWELTLRNRLLDPVLKRLQDLHHT